MVQTGPAPAPDQHDDSSRAHTPFPKDCKSCGGAVDLLESYKHLALRRKQEQQANSQAMPGQRPQPTQHTTPSQQPTPVPQASADSETHSLQCPPDSAELGRATWTFLHTMAATYPEQPSRSQQTLMRNIIDGLAEFYPCSYCRSHFQLQV